MSRFCAIILLLVSIPVSAFEGVPLSWQAPTENVDGSPLTNLASYRIYYGLSSREYTGSIDIVAGENSYSISLPGATIGTEYYIAMTAIDALGDESEYSNEVRKPVREIPGPDQGIILNIAY